MNSENISFFIPAYNCADTITESVNSIIDTNLSVGDEIVITDDASTDDTEKVLGNLAAKYQFISIIKHNRNRGGAAARNTAIENAKNEILFCLDSDNILPPRSIEPLKKILIENKADGAVFKTIYFFKNSIQTIHKKTSYDHDRLTIDEIFKGNSSPISSGNYMFTRASWIKAGGYPEENWLDTWGFGIRQLFSGARICVLPDSYYYHRRGHESYTIRELKRSNVSLTALQLLIPYLNRISEQSENYILSRRGRYSWFENLETKPIRLAVKKREVTPTYKMQEVKNALKGSFPAIYRSYLRLRFGKNDQSS